MRYLSFLWLAGCGMGPDPNVDYDREDSFDRLIPIRARVEDACERSCTGAVDHDPKRCGDSTCDSHRHRAGEWALVEPDLETEVREAMESATLTFLADLKPEIRGEFKEDPEGTIAKVRKLLIEETRARISPTVDAIRTRVMEELRARRRSSEAGCNSSGIYTWTARVEVELDVQMLLRISGPREDAAYSADVRVRLEIDVELEDPTLRVEKRAECPCKGN